MSADPKPDNRPTLHTDNLILRPSSFDDVDAISEILSDRAIPDTAMYIPHPFHRDIAREWISKHPQKYEDGISVVFYIDQKETSELIGAIQINIESENQHGELGYYIAKPHWGHGYATESVIAVVNYGFDQLKLERIFAWCLCRNEPSKRVLVKAGLKPEGILRKHILKWDVLEDVQYFGILKSEYKANM